MRWVDLTSVDDTVVSMITRFRIHSLYKAAADTFARHFEWSSASELVNALDVDDWRNTLTHPDLYVVEDSALIEVRYLFSFCDPNPRSNRQF